MTSTLPPPGRRRLARTCGDYRTERQVQEIFGGSQWGKTLRWRMLDPLFYAQDLVEWRNHQASLDVRSLATTTADGSIDALQEYFVPMAALERFAGALRTILRRHAVNVINVSIRHALKDPGTLLAWARMDVFAFVLYYRKETELSERDALRGWTRELIDAALAQDESFYLPYQIHASTHQFRTAYPDAGRFFALKRQVDPQNRFRNKLWDAYYRPEFGRP